MRRLLAILFLVAVVAGVFSTVCAEKKLTIAGIVFQEDQFMKTVLIGMKAAADKYGVELLTANTANQITKEIEVVNTYTARGVDAICITALSDTASVPALQAAHDKGIKVVCFNSPIKADFPVSTIASSNADLGASTGKAARQYILSKLKGQKEIQVATINFKPQLPADSDARENNFLLQLMGINGVKVVSQQSAWLIDTGTKVAGDIITANPKLKIIYGCNDGATKGAVLAVKNAGKAGKIAVFGIDTDAQIAQFLLSKDNILQAVTGQDPFKIGYMSVEFAVKALKGESLPKTVVVPGQLLSRTDPKAVQAFADSLK
ncbi:MAG: substrate-binding domain-containing protein [Patescibacteria group bacterium]